MQVADNIRSVRILYRLMKMVDALMVNDTLRIEPYLHQLLPKILTCVVAKKLCHDDEEMGEAQWILRDYASNIVQKICSK